MKRVIKMSEYLSLIPKPLLDDFINDNVVPFVGAGFSKNAKMPYNISMPDWKELGEKVAFNINDFEYLNPIDSFSVYEKEFSRSKLIEILSQELHINEIEPSETYISFCDLFYDTICTTNFDFLLEDTLQELRRPSSVITNEEKLSINFKNSTKLIKIHGDFNNPQNMVITENDYDLFLSNNKLLSTYLSNLFITKTIFLVGYSFDDYDIRNIWQIINDRLGKLKRFAYCVMVDANKSEIAKFERRNIKVINLPGKKKDYPKILECFFKEIKEFISGKKELVSNDNKVKKELLLPDKINKICYVAAPHQILSQLKEYVFPSLNDISITPTILDDVLYPTDNWLVKSELLIQKSRIALVDISQENSNVDWEINTLYKYNKNIIFISNIKSSKLLKFSESSNTHQIFYKQLDDDDFLEELKHVFNSMLVNELILEKKESQRLFDNKEYDKAALLALSELEDKIRTSKIFDVPYNFSFNNLLYQLYDMNVLSIKFEMLKDCINLRNQLIHNSCTITRANAKRIINFTEIVTNDINKAEKSKN